MDDNIAVEDTDNNEEGSVVKVEEQPKEKPEINAEVKECYV